MQAFRSHYPLFRRPVFPSAATAQSGAGPPLVRGLQKSVPASLPQSTGAGPPMIPSVADTPEVPLAATAPAAQSLPSDQIHRSVHPDVRRRPNVRPLSGHGTSPAHTPVHTKRYSLQPGCIFLCCGRGYSSTSSNWSLPTPQTGQTQSSGISSNEVPGAMPPSGSPTCGS